MNIHTIIKPLVINTQLNKITTNLKSKDIKIKNVKKKQKEINPCVNPKYKSDWPLFINKIPEYLDLN